MWKPENMGRRAHHWKVGGRLHQLTILFHWAENQVVVGVVQQSSVRLKHGKYIAGTGMIFAPLQPSTKLAQRAQKGQIVGTDIILGHVYNGGVQRHLAMVVGCLLSNSSRQLSHLDLLAAISLQARVQNFSLSRLREGSR